MSPLDAPADPATEQEILRLTGEWPRILVEKDMAGLDRLLAPDVLFVEGDGEVYDRARYTARVHDAAPLRSVRYTHRRVRAYGDAAVLTGRSVVTPAEGEAKTYSVTDVFARGSDGAWRVVSGQMTPLTRPDAQPATNPVGHERR